MQNEYVFSFFYENGLGFKLSFQSYFSPNLLYFNFIFSNKFFTIICCVLIFFKEEGREEFFFKG